MHYAEAALVYRIVARRSMAADSGRLREACAPERTGSGRSPSDTSYRVAKRSFDRSSARRSCPQVPQCHPRVAKGTSIGTLARGPSTEALLGQGRVPKGIGTVAGIKVGFTTGFGTAHPATGGSEAGPCDEGDIYRHFATGTPSTGTSVASQCGERPADRSMTGN